MTEIVSDPDSTAPFPFNCKCKASPTSDGEIEPMGDNLSMIFSPGFGKEEYPNRQLCRYSMPECPEGYGQMIMWNENDFRLQSASSFIPEYCLDFLQLILPESLNIDAQLDPSGSSSSHILCGQQGAFDVQINTNKEIKVI